MIDGIEVFRWVTGRVSATSSATAIAPYTSGRRHRRSAQAADLAERGSPEPADGNGSLSSLGPSFASTAGSRVSVAASTKTTASMIPKLVERNAGLGTSITALSETSTVAPLKRTALPAVSIVTAAASVADSCEPENAARKRWTTKSA